MNLEAGYRSNSLLKREGVVIEFTEEQIQEYIKCSEDPIYFIENYMTVVHVDKGVVPFKLYEYQKEMLKAIHENRHVIVLAARQSGKCFFSSMLLKLRNKRTGEVKEISIGDFYESQKTLQKPLPMI